MSEPAATAAPAVSAAASAGLLEGIGSEVVVCMFILLAGLILVAAWLSTYVPQDMRPIAVFVFENFGRNRPPAEQQAVTATAAATAAAAAATSGTTAAAAPLSPPAAVPAALTGPSVASSADEPPAPTPSQPSALTPPQAGPSTPAEAAATTAAAPADLSAYDVDVLESDGDLDPEMRERVEDVLQEYTQVMEARSDSELRNRRLKYFNCLLAAQPASPAANDTPVSISDGGGIGGDSVPASASAYSPSTGTAAVGENDTEAISSVAAAATAPASASAVPASASAAAASAAAPADAASRPPGSLQLRLKYFNDDLRTVVALPTESITNFKRKHFQPELSRNMNIRLIYNGRELKEGTDRTLASYAIPEDATIHCLITERSPGEDLPGGSAGNGVDADAAGHLDGQGDIGSYMFPLFGGILGIIWYCRVCYKAYFNFMSTMALGAVTLLFFAAFFASWSARPSRQAGQIHVHRINLEAQQQQPPQPPQQPLQPQEQQS